MLKRNRKEIRVLDFFLLWLKLNIFSLLTKQKENLANLGI